jgi:hypothetical protein
MMALGIALAVSGCAGTRQVALGPLASRQPLLTLVVTEDLQLVRRECGMPQDPGIALLGCKTSRLGSLRGGGIVTVVKIVQYADTLPSASEFEFGARQLCRTLASLQAIDDPCAGVTR